MARIITGATGLIGKTLTFHWLQENHPVIVIGRSIEKIKAIFGERVQAMTWNQLTVDVLQRADLVVHLAGANIGEKRWSDKRKQTILTSRTEPTEKIATLMSKLGKNSPPLFCASAVGVYGLQSTAAFGLPARLDENTLIDWDHASDFLSRVGRRWEKAAEPAVRHGVRVVFLRFGVVLAKEGGALPQLVRPFKFYLGGPIGTGRQAFSWVTLDDLIRAIDFIISQPTVSGPINVVAPECVTQSTLAEGIARILKVPAKIPMPAWTMRLLLGREMANELLLEGQNVYPKRLLEMGFTFLYPTIDAALKHLLHHAT